MRGHSERRFGAERLSYGGRALIFRIFQQFRTLGQSIGVPLRIGLHRHHFGREQLDGARREASAAGFALSVRIGVLSKRGTEHLGPSEVPKLEGHSQIIEQVGETAGPTARMHLIGRRDDARRERVTTAKRAALDVAAEVPLVLSASLKEVGLLDTRVALALDLAFVERVAGAER